MMNLDDDLELHVARTESVDPIVPVRWCLKPELKEYLTEQKVENPLILIVTTTRGREESRIIVPLEQGLQYVEFYRSGPHHVLATILWDRDKTPGELVRKYTRRYSSTTFTEEVLNIADHTFFTDMGVSRVGNAVLEVEVVDGHFAKKPPRWEQWWVNLWYSIPAWDQCEFRKRRIPAYLVKPLVVPVWVLLKTILRLVCALWLLLIGMRGINFNPLIHPFDDDLIDIWLHIQEGDSIFLRNKQGKRRSFLWLSFAPVIPMVFFLGLSILFWVSEGQNLWAALVGALLLWGGVIFAALGIWGLVKLCSLLFAGISALAFFIGGPLAVLVDWLKRGQQQKAVLPPVLQYYEKLEYLVCTTEPVVVSVRALPAERQTVKLRFLDLKARVCRPFSRG